MLIPFNSVVFHPGSGWYIIWDSIKQQYARISENELKGKDLVYIAAETAIPMVYNSGLQYTRQQLLLEWDGFIEGYSSPVTFRTGNEYKIPTKRLIQPKRNSFGTESNPTQFVPSFKSIDDILSTWDEIKS